MYSVTVNDFSSLKPTFCRLSEFECTPSSKLTISEFMEIDLEAEHDPPAFINSRIKAKLLQLENEAGGMHTIESERNTGFVYTFYKRLLNKSLCNETGSAPCSLNKRTGYKHAQKYILYCFVRMCCCGTKYIFSTF